MNDEIRVAIIDDHPLVREGVVHVLMENPDFEVVAQGATAKEAVEIAKLHAPDVLVLDISIPGGGILALEAIRASASAVRVLILTASSDESDVFDALRLGAKGYVLKGVDGPELIQAIRTVFLEGSYLSPSLGAQILINVYNEKIQPKSHDNDALSDREEEIFALVSQGMSNKLIGLKLQLSEKTVKHYMTNLFKKLHVHTRFEAAIMKKRKIE